MPESSGNKCVAIMQPYFIPYLGYFQLIHAVDEFILLDDVEYSKGGWYNRNNLLLGGRKHMCTLPVVKTSDYSLVSSRSFIENIEKEKGKIERIINQAYSKSPFYGETRNLIETILHFQDRNLVNFNANGLKAITAHLGIQTKISFSSDLNIPRDLKNVERVLEICRKKKATSYVNAIGGIDLYDQSAFNEQNIQLSFIKMHEIVYEQRQVNFIPHLSIIDVIFHNGISETRRLLDRFDLI